MSLLRDIRKDLNRAQPIVWLRRENPLWTYLEKTDNEIILQKFYDQPQHNTELFKIVMDYVHRYGSTIEEWDTNSRRERQLEKKIYNILFILTIIGFILWLTFL